MAGILKQIRGLLHEAGETHHQVFRIVDGPTMTGRAGTRSGSSTSRPCSASGPCAATERQPRIFGDLGSRCT
jgi:hypothetical protein